MTTLHAFHPYTIGGGGLLERVDTWLRLPPGVESAWRRRAGVYILLTYVPLVVMGVIWRLTTGHWDPVIANVDTHVRALVAAPTLLFAEHIIDIRSRIAGNYLLTAEIIRGDDVAAYHRVVERTERLRNSVLADSLLLLIAISSNLYNFESVLHMARPGHYWGSFAAVTLFRFLLFRWLWRWSLWAIFLQRVARMPLWLSAIHPDRVGGLAVLSTPSEGFAILAGAGAATLAGAWLDRILDGIPLAVFYGPIVAYVVIMVSLALAPLLVFTSKLNRLRKAGRCEYGAFAQRYCAAFQDMWFERSGESALGADDISGLADLGASYGVLSEMRIVVGDRRLLATLVVASLAPILPLALAEVSALDLVLRLAKALG
jgi:hypothetical protein